MKNQKAVFLLPCLVSFAAAATTWTIYPTDQDGMTPSQQLTNAVARASSGDTILFKLGTYQLDGESFMETASSGTGNSMVTSRCYVRLSSKQVNFVGEADGAWSDGVVLRGNGYDRFAYANSDKATFRNLTFENFASSDRPDLSVTEGNLDYRVLGGAIRYGAFADGNIISNCVFRGNVARSAGAVGYGAAIDCFFTNNIARSYSGGAAACTSLKRCVFVGNMATNSTGFGGAVWWPFNAFDCTFVGNCGKAYAGAIVGDANRVVSNCVFRRNEAWGPAGNAWTGGGGVMNLRPNATIIDCTFEENFANGPGGVIASWNFDGNNGGKGSVVRRCTFTGNISKSHGGAIYEAHDEKDGPLKIYDCTFTGNVASGNGGAVCSGAFSNCTFASNTAACGAALYMSLSNRIEDCTFVKNFATNNAWMCGIVVGESGKRMQIVDCVFSNNYNRKNGLLSQAVCTNTLFYGNEVPQQGGVVKNCEATDCRFVGNRKYDTMFGLIVPAYSVTPDANFPSGDATESTLVRCDMDLGCILDCVLTDCHIHTLTNKGAYCVFYGDNVATNCLIENCTPPDQGRGLVYRWGPIAASHVTGSDYVNCTFADNVFPRFLNHQKESGVYTPFKNCLFYNNRTSRDNGKLIDLMYRINDTGRGTQRGLDSGLALSNCVYGVAGPDPSLDLGTDDTWRDLGGNRLIAPNALMVAGARAAALGVHKYALRPESPAIGMGDASMFTAADLDYAGNLRLREGRLDPGCFECWLNTIGTRFIFR